MKTSCTQAPVLFNGWKHHLGFVLKELNAFKPVDAESFQAFCVNLRVMGSSLSDFYTGILSPDEISSETCYYLKNIGAFESNDYRKWIDDSGKNYREIYLSDGSRWTLIKCSESNFFVHIHPSKNSQHTRRIKGNKLRTAVAMIAYQKLTETIDYELGTINLIRKKYLNLSPVNQHQIPVLIKTIESLVPDYAQV